MLLIVFITKVFNIGDDVSHVFVLFSKKEMGLKQTAFGKSLLFDVFYL